MADLQRRELLHHDEAETPTQQRHSDDGGPSPPASPPALNRDSSGRASQPQGTTTSRQGATHEPPRGLYRSILITYEDDPTADPRTNDIDFARRLGDLRQRYPHMTIRGITHAAASIPASQLIAQPPPVAGRSRRSAPRVASTDDAVAGALGASVLSAATGGAWRHAAVATNSGEDLGGATKRAAGDQRRGARRDGREGRKEFAAVTRYIAEQQQQWLAAPAAVGLPPDDDRRALPRYADAGGLGASRGVVADDGASPPARGDLVVWPGATSHARQDVSPSTSEASSLHPRRRGDDSSDVTTPSSDGNELGVTPSIVRRGMRVQLHSDRHASPGLLCCPYLGALGRVVKVVSRDRFLVRIERRQQQPSSLLEDTDQGFKEPSSRPRIDRHNADVAIVRVAQWWCAADDVVVVSSFVAS